MNHDLAIRVEGLGKLYRLGASVDLTRTFRETLMTLPRFFASHAVGAARKLARQARQAADSAGRPPDGDAAPPGHFWALRDVSFDVQRGEVIGIIGRNGAGKSTLLKILSRITSPTAGRAEVHGRLSSLLEVGTGFHPELTGRENIYLNGAILGMRKAEIDRKFDEIVAFAEVERFLDTPVKRYSSGMYVRLAFAVAAHLEPEVLVVDEVLAVGDAQFQKKCLGKMNEVAQGGRTVLFVSHNMAAVQSLCGSAALLEGGRLVRQGATRDVIDYYMAGLTDAKSVVSLSERADRRGDGSVRLTALTIRNAKGEEAISCGDELTIAIDYEAARSGRRLEFLLGCYDYYNQPVFFMSSARDGGIDQPFPARGRINCRTGPLQLTPGPCLINVAALAEGRLADHVIQAHCLEVQSADFYGTGRLTDRRQALCLIPQSWTVEDRAGDESRAQ